ncbi:hypothetical protein DVH24_027097 [Malus domestica]|uniref:Uncharacterized protein n=1 Tax=Malus domestica TaxID=3750 RepID=A0A498IKW4_MALDO|nr:hypothetical protein DVH24_027097 [Malus domestica]
MSVNVRNTAVPILISKKSNNRRRLRRRHSPYFGMLPSEKPKGPCSLQLQIDGDKTTITMDFKSSQSVSKGFTRSEVFFDGTINIAYRWEDFIFVGVDSKLTKHEEVTSLDYKKFYELSTNIYITMAGSKEIWEFMYKSIASEHHTVEAAALLAHMILMIATDAEPDLACKVGCLVLGWDFTSSHPQMFRVVAGNSLTTRAMALDQEKNSNINLQDQTESYHEKLADALLNRVCLSVSYCGGTRGSCKEIIHHPASIVVHSISSLRMKLGSDEAVLMV